MNTPYIRIELPRRMVDVPNRWELLSPSCYAYVLMLIERWATGELSVMAVHTAYVCHVLGLNPRRATRRPDDAATIYLIASSIDFIFVWSADKQQYQLRPARFAAQVLPTLRLRHRRWHGYQVAQCGGMLSTNLTAIQFVDALRLLPDPEHTLTVALILYTQRGKRYNAERTLQLAERYRHKLSAHEELRVLLVVHQFGALVAFLMAQPYFSVLNSTSSASPSERSGLSTTLYQLCRDGLGSAEEVEQMPALKFLELVRDKVIEGIRTLSATKMSDAEIAEKTNLPISVISQYTTT